MANASQISAVARNSYNLLLGPYFSKFHVIWTLNFANFVIKTVFVTIFADNFMFCKLSICMLQFCSLTIFAGILTQDTPKNNRDILNQNL